MLHRAASNAYSWWWASHIRTKQSKWLDNNLQEMDEKVQYMLKLIDEDGDSFAKRAESYYRKRPELISFVEEFYRAYRSLAERYDHISGELQNANHTIATVFPEQVQFAMDEEDEETASPKMLSRQLDPSKLPKDLPEAPKINIPSFLKNLKKDKSAPEKSMKKMQSRKSTSAAATTGAGNSSGMSKDQAIEEIDKLQKGILALQTEKEFVKSSYENRLGKYWEIEKAITEMQEKVCGLQDEFSVGSLIEDNEARTLMASTALKSCQETLVQLQEKQEKSSEEAKVEYERVRDAHKKFVALKNEFLQNHTDLSTSEKEHVSEGSTLKSSGKEISETLKLSEQEGGDLKQEILSTEAICEKIREHFEMNSGASLTVPELAEKIDALVTKVISLETAVSTQTALIKTLRTETDDLQEHLRTLEEDKATLLQDSSKLNEKLKELEGELHSVQDLNKNVENQNNNLQTHFTEAHCNLDHLSEKLKSVKPLEEENEFTTSPEAKVDSLLKTPKKRFNEPADFIKSSEKSINEKEKATEAEEVQDSSLHVNDEGEAPAQPGSSRSGLEDVAQQTQESKKVGDEKEDLSQLNTKQVSDEKQDSSDLETKQESDEKQDSSQTDIKPSDVKLDSSQAELKQLVDDRQDSPITEDNVLISESQEQSSDQEDEPNWQQLFLGGLEDRERILLSEYTSILRKYKDTRKQLSELQMKNNDSQFEAMVQLRELKSAISMKDEEIQSLRQKLKLMQESDHPQKERAHFNSEVDFFSQSCNEATVNFDHQQISDLLQDSIDEATEKPDTSSSDNAAETLPTREEEEDEVRVTIIQENRKISSIEEKFRRDIDELLEENLEFWLRFSGLFHQIQKFQTSIEDLQGEYTKLKESKTQEESTTSKHSQSLKSDARPIYKHLREIQTELTVWIEQNMLLKDELKYRLSSLCNIQEELKRVPATSTAAEVEFTSYQAAKFQGEVINMQQENNKVADELQAGLEHVKGLQVEIDKTLTQMNEELKLSGSKNHHTHHVIHSLSRTRIPLRSFLFGVKAKKQKPSLFACINPALQKQYSDLHSHMPDKEGSK